MRVHNVVCILVQPNLVTSTSACHAWRLVTAFYFCLSMTWRAICARPYRARQLLGTLRAEVAYDGAGAGAGEQREGEHEAGAAVGGAGGRGGGEREGLAVGGGGVGEGRDVLADEVARRLEPEAHARGDLVQSGKLGAGTT